MLSETLRGGETKFGWVKESLFKKKRFPPTHPNLSHSHGRNIESYLDNIVKQFALDMTQRNTVHYNLDVIVMTTSQHTSDNDAFVLLKNLTRFRVVFKTNFRKSSYAKAHLLFQKVLLKISFCKLRFQSFFQKESPLYLHFGKRRSRGRSFIKLPLSLEL